MVIKRSPGGESAGGGRSTSKSTCAVPEWSLTVFGDRPASSMSNFSASVNSDLGNGSFWVKVGDAEHVDRCSWKCTRVWSYQLTSDLRDVYFIGYACNGHVWKQFRCLRLSLIGGLRGSTATSALVGCHDGHFKALSRCRLVGSCVRPGENSLRMPMTTFARLTQSQAISQSVAFSSLSMGDTNKFHFFFFISWKSFFHVSFTMVIKIISWWRICRRLAVNFKIHLCNFGMNSDLRECFFWGLCKLVITSTDLWPQEMFTFLKMHAMGARLHGLVRKLFQPSRRACAFFHGRPVGLHAHVPLVRCVSSLSVWGAEQKSACG